MREPFRADELLARSAEAFPGKEALVCGQSRHTFASLEHAVAACARALRELGVGRGDRVVAWLENSFEAVVLAFAAMRADAVFCLANPSTPLHRLAWMLDDCRPAALAFPAARGEEAAGRLLPQAPGLRAAVTVGGPAPGCVAFQELLHAPAGPLARAALDVDLAGLFYTSGSTGGPKAVMLSHRNLRSTSLSIAGYLEGRPDDVLWCALPLSFDYGFFQTLAMARTGARLVLEKGFLFPWEAMAAMEREEVTGLPAVPTMLALILRLADPHRHPLPRLRWITSTGAPLPAQHVRALRRAWPHARLYSMYGLTECTRVSFLDPSLVDAKPSSVGRPIPNTEAWIEASDGRRCGPGETGELVVRGSNVAMGYWGDLERTSGVFRRGARPGEVVLRTGDLFRTDEEGLLYFVARTDDVLKVRGQKVAPREVEEALLSCPGVMEAAVVGAADELEGTALRAFVVPAPGPALDAAHLRRHCMERLEEFKVPRTIEVVEELPRTPHGKVDRGLLAARA